MVRLVILWKKMCNFFSTTMLFKFNVMTSLQYMGVKKKHYLNLYMLSALYIYILNRISSYFLGNKNLYNGGLGFWGFFNCGPYDTVDMWAISAWSVNPASDSSSTSYHLRDVHGTLFFYSFCAVIIFVCTCPFLFSNISISQNIYQLALY